MSDLQVRKGKRSFSKRVREELRKSGEEIPVGALYLLGNSRWIGRKREQFRERKTGSEGKRVAIIKKELVNQLGGKVEIKRRDKWSDELW